MKRIVIKNRKRCDFSFFSKYILKVNWLFILRQLLKIKIIRYIFETHPLSYICAMKILLLDVLIEKVLTIVNRRKSNFFTILYRFKIDFFLSEGGGSVIRLSSSYAVFVNLSVLVIHLTMSDDTYDWKYFVGLLVNQIKPNSFDQDSLSFD